LDFYDKKATTKFYGGGKFILESRKSRHGWWRLRKL